MAKLLIIEDDPNTLHVFSTALEHDGHEVEVVDNGRAGTRRALEDHFDLVLLDIGLPAMSGTEVLHRLRAKASNDDLPVLVVSAYARP